MELVAVEIGEPAGVEASLVADFADEVGRRDRQVLGPGKADVHDAEAVQEGAGDASRPVGRRQELGAAQIGVRFQIDLVEGAAPCRLQQGDQGVREGPFSDLVPAFSISSMMMTGLATRSRWIVCNGTLARPVLHWRDVPPNAASATPAAL